MEGIFKAAKVASLFTGVHSTNFIHPNRSLPKHEMLFHFIQLDTLKNKTILSASDGACGCVITVNERLQPTRALGTIDSPHNLPVGLTRKALIAGSLAPFADSNGFTVKDEASKEFPWKDFPEIKKRLQDEKQECWLITDDGVDIPSWMMHIMRNVMAFESLSSPRKLCLYVEENGEMRLGSEDTKKPDYAPNELAYFGLAGPRKERMRMPMDWRVLLKLLQAVYLYGPRMVKFGVPKNGHAQWQWSFTSVEGHEVLLSMMGRAE